MITDHHMHTSLCGHAEGEPREYVERALELGMTELGFADHLPLVRNWKAGYTMRHDQLEDYVAMVRALAEEYASDITILLSVEADYFEGAEADIAELLGAHPFDYVIGSVHEVGDGFAFDGPGYCEDIESYGVDRIYLEYYDLVARAAASGLFDVAGHLDLPKKFGHRPQDAKAVAAAASAALRAVAAAGMTLEINTRGLLKRAGETYPSPALLAEAAGLGIPLIFSSDAHRPEEVGHGFAEAAAVARAAGYTSVARLSGGPPEALP
jgi:histidinol-phosphatase (PHP family)